MRHYRSYPVSLVSLASRPNTEEKEVLKDLRLSHKDARKVKQLLAQPRPCLLCSHPVDAPTTSTACEHAAPMCP